MEIWLFAIFFSFSAFLLLLSVMRNSRIIGTFSGFFFLMVYMGISTTGLTVPFGTTEVVGGNTTTIYQNMTDVFSRSDQLIQTGFGITLLGFAVYVMAANLFNMIEDRRAPS